MMFDGIMSAWQKRGSFKTWMVATIFVRFDDGYAPHNRVRITLKTHEKGIAVLDLEPDQALCLGIELEQAAHWLKRGPKGQ